VPRPVSPSCLCDVRIRSADFCVMVSVSITVSFLRIKGQIQAVPDISQGTVHQVIR
jgi:hypothetical protein